MNRVLINKENSSSGDIEISDSTEIISTEDRATGTQLEDNFTQKVLTEHNQKFQELEREADKSRKKISNSVKAFKKELAIIKEEQTASSKKMQKEFTDSQGELTKKIQDSGNRSLSTLTLFITLFTFISVNVSIFQNITNLRSAVLFMFIMAFFCLIIVSVPIIILQSINGQSLNVKLYWQIFCVGMAGLFCIGLLSLFFTLNIEIESSDVDVASPNIIQIESQNNNLLSY